MQKISKHIYVKPQNNGGLILNLYRYVSMEERLLLKSNMKVLDVGCGFGELLAGLKNKNVLCIGLDLTRSKLVKAHNKRENINFVLGDACYLPFSTSFFDVVTSRQFVSHVWNLDIAIKEMRRVCTGIFYMEDSNMFNPVVLMKLLFRFGPSWFWTKTKVYHQSDLSQYGKAEDIHSMFWWKRKLRRSMIILTRKHFYNPLLDLLWKYFGPDCIFRIQQDAKGDDK